MKTRTCLTRLWVAGIVVCVSLSATPGTSRADSFIPLPADSPGSIASCVISPSDVTWESAEDVVPILIDATPDRGFSVYSVSVKPDGGSEVPWLDNFTLPRAAPPDGTDFVEYIGATYDSLLDALGGTGGTVRLAIYLPTATSLADTPLCEAVIRIVGLGELPETGSARPTILLTAALLVLTGTAILALPHRGRRRSGETLAL